MKPGADMSLAWLYDEFKHAGVDYADPCVVQEYDQRHTQFRNYEKDAKLIIDRLALGPEHTVIDFGCGTGAFVIPAARTCRKIHAVDVSPAMLQSCEQKARAAGIDNVETHCSGFLTFQLADDPVDAIISVAALHHLPDFWKTVALYRMHSMLRPGGMLYLFDVVFSFPVGDYAEKLDGWIHGMRQSAGQAMAEENIIHVREEFSTFDWILESMLVRTGFVIEKQYEDFPMCRTYICRK